MCLSPQVDERARVAAREAELGRRLDTTEMVQYLARLKAEDVAQRHGHDIDGLILGGDSAFQLDDEILGKPHEPDIALQRAKEHRGRSGTLFSGHWVIDCAGGEVRGAVGGVDTATVTMSENVTDAELAKYVGTGEPLELAGGFAIDGLAGAFIKQIVGAPSCVIGLSLPRFRELVIELGHDYTNLWESSE